MIASRTINAFIVVSTSTSCGCANADAEDALKTPTGCMRKDARNVKAQSLIKWSGMIARRVEVCQPRRQVSVEIDIRERGLAKLVVAAEPKSEASAFDNEILYVCDQRTPDPALAV